MTPAQRQEIARHLASFDFSGLFTDSALGWNWPTATKRLRVPYASGFLELATVAEKCGVKILQCPPDSSGRIPLSEERRKIEKAVAPLASEHLIIFTDKDKTRQIWQWPAKRPGKPTALRELTWEKGKANELLLQKLTSIAFTLDEEEGLDITGVVRRMADSLDRDRVTKRFYDLFKKQKDAFQKFIKGLSDTGLQAWYTSLMLNRIMFCYFLQRKGFLDGDQNYLANRLSRVQDQIGKNKFHSFYRSFLRRLFHEGLGSQERSQELIALIGSIPYLNGGIFDEHPIERGHPGLSIPDEAFEKVFKFFDQFDWHLDDRPIGNDKEINPEILGYVFEKYTNQKEMGAYYTKEDITEYISKNCIIPFLVHAIAGRLPDTAWQMLQSNPDRYIYEAVRRGAGSTAEEWTASLPKNIVKGLDTTQPKLIERRKDWNTTTPPSHGLPTEIWRETIARQQRCHELRAKLRAGEVKTIDDFVTLNLDIRQFAQDVIESADASLLLAFFERLKKLSILDPTCGSGAFLFAALEILEPLYSACIQRFRAILADWQSSGEKHPNWEKEIKAILDHAAAHPNEGYYIHKTIIVHNLYGVDIMEEAVEICKLRLFLKLAAQLQPGQQVEPLPDIDFNIRAGNTLVGYASRDEVRRAFTEHQGGGKDSQLLLGGIEHSLDDYRRIEEQAEDADRAFQRFHQLQEDTKMDAAAFRSAKQNLHETLKVMRDQLDRFLAGDYDKAKHLNNDAAFTNWCRSHQPFHWFIEFYGIMNKGGFDVVIGNPPYAEVPKHLGRKPLCGLYRTALTEWSRDEDLYTMVVERSISLINRTSGTMGMILPLSLAFSTKRPFVALRSIVQELCGNWWWSHFDRIPSSLFGNEVRTRCTIGLWHNGVSPSSCHRTTSLLRWNGDARWYLFKRLRYARINTDLAIGIPRVDSQAQASALEGMQAINRPLGLTLRRAIPFEQLVASAPRFPAKSVFVGGTAYNWFPAWRDIPKTTKEDGSPSLPARTSCYQFNTEEEADMVFALLCSSIGYWWWAVASDGFNLKKWLLERFPLSPEAIPERHRPALAKLGSSLRAALRQQYVFKDNKGRIGNYYLPACTGQIEAIDSLLAVALPCLSLSVIEEIRGLGDVFTKNALAQADEADSE